MFRFMYFIHLFVNEWPGLVGGGGSQASPDVFICLVNVCLVLKNKNVVAQN